jgi:ABC-2 type transport system permease protein
MRADFQYRLSFFSMAAGQFFITFLDFLAILVIFTKVEALGGWSVAEVAVLYGLSGVAFVLADVFVGQVEACARRIKDGSFDLLLIRPLGPLLQLSADEFAIRRVGKLVQATGVLVVALVAADIAWSPAAVVWLLVSITAGAVIAGSVWIVSSSLSFWTVDTQEVANTFTYGGNYLTSYPLHIFSEWLRNLLAFVVPLAFVSYYPALVLLDRADPLGLPDGVRFAGPAAAVAAAFLARTVWRIAVRHYQSTGS